MRRRLKPVQVSEREDVSSKCVAKAAFNTVGTSGGRVTNVNVAGDYIVGDEDPGGHILRSPVCSPSDSIVTCSVKDI